MAVLVYYGGVSRCRLFRVDRQESVVLLYYGFPSSQTVDLLELETISSLATLPAPATDCNLKSFCLVSDILRNGSTTIHTYQGRSAPRGNPTIHHGDQAQRKYFKKLLTISSSQKVDEEAYPKSKTITNHHTNRKRSSPRDTTNSQIVSTMVEGGVSSCLQPRKLLWYVALSKLRNERWTLASDDPNG
jgi:hypothetical protein